MRRDTEGIADCLFQSKVCEEASGKDCQRKVFASALASPIRADLGRQPCVWRVAVAACVLMREARLYFVGDGSCYGSPKGTPNLRWARSRREWASGSPVSRRAQAHKHCARAFQGRISVGLSLPTEQVFFKPFVARVELNETVSAKTLAVARHPACRPAWFLKRRGVHASGRYFLRKSMFCNKPNCCGNSSRMALTKSRQY